MKSRHPRSLPPRALPLALLVTAACGSPSGEGGAMVRPARECLSDPGCEAIVVVAHRGLRAEGVPENSLAAIRKTAEAGVPMVELDVRETADGVLVLMHDPEVDRTTNLTGRVTEMTWEELSEAKLLRADESDPEASRVPRFDEALALTQELGLSIYLDMKTSRVDLVAAALDEAGAWDSVLVRKDTPKLEEFIALEPRVWMLPTPGTKEEAEEMLARLPGLRVVELSGLQQAPELIAELGELGLVVQQDVMVLGDVIYLLSGDTSGFRNYVEAGARVLQSDLPDVLLAWLEAEGYPVLRLF